jgi:hypothetical protein
VFRVWEEPSLVAEDLFRKEPLTQQRPVDVLVTPHFFLPIQDNVGRDWKDVKRVPYQITCVECSDSLCRISIAVGFATHWDNTLWLMPCIMQDAEQYRVFVDNSITLTRQLMDLLSPPKNVNLKNSKTRTLIFHSLVVS